MNKDNQTNGAYLAPEIEVIELRNCSVLCQSGGIGVMGFGSDQDGDSNF